MIEKQKHQYSRLGRRSTAAKLRTIVLSITSLTHTNIKDMFIVVR